MAANGGDISDCPATSKRTFFKRTRRGKVVKLVQERYLRSDLYCGFLRGSEVVRAEDLKRLVAEAPYTHILVIDTNIALHQIDLLEHDCPATALVVLTQTALLELRHLNVSVYKRLLSLLKDEKKMYIFYPNEQSMESAVVKRAGESVNDANDRAIRRVCSHLAKEIEEVGTALLLSNDVENRRRAQQEGIQVLGMTAYVEKYLSEYPEMLDLVSVSSSDVEGVREGSDIFEPHLSMTDILAGLKTKKFFRGVIRCSRDGLSDYYVVIHRDDGSRASVQIHGREQANRAIDGDVVAVHLQESMASRAPDFALTPTITSDVAAETAEASVEAIEGLPSEPAPAQNGRVVGIIRRNWRQYAGSLVETAATVGSFTTTSESSDGSVVGSSVESVLFRPVDKKVPCILINTRRRAELEGNRLLVAIGKGLCKS
jgi:exosome complex exonuclease DIS3/RRP44